MDELLDEFINIGIIQENEVKADGYRNILFRLSYRRKLYTAGLIISPEGSIVLHIYDGHLFEYEGGIYCISDWKYRDLEEPTSNVTEAVWEKTSPWILKCDFNMQFMCKTIHLLKVAESGDCQILSWKSDVIQEIGFIINTINDLIKSTDTNQALCDLAIEILNRGLRVDDPCE